MFTFVDLFAGIGGFHAALSSLGGECVLAVEKDEEAARVYEANWGIDPRGDVTTPGWTDALDHVDVVVGGFPCQPFSKGGAQLGMSETRGTLFYSVLEAVAAWQPEVVLLENVRNLLGPKHTHTWDVILRSLRSLGYSVSSEPLVVSPHWLPAAAGGSPQSRERVFILATRSTSAAADLAWAKTVELPSRPGPWDLAVDLPLQLTWELEPGEEAELSCSADELAWLGAWAEFVQLARGAGADLPGFPLWVDAWRASTWPLAPGWKQTFEIKNQAWYLANRTWVEPWLSSSGVLAFPPSRRKLEWQAQGAAGLEKCLVQLRPSGLRVKQANHAGALVAIDQRPILPWLGRRLSVRECARLQGFPEWFSFEAVSRRAAFKQLGNAVNAGVVRWVLAEHLSNPSVRACLASESPLLAVPEHAKAPA